MDVLKLFSLEGKVAIVTGASRGLGQAMAIALAEAGADIVGVSRSEAEQSETKMAIEKIGRRYFAIGMDLSQFEKIGSIVESAVKKFGRVDILVNNAGVIKRAPVTEYSVEDWDKVLNINLKAAFLLSQYFSRYAIENGIKARIINVASMLSFQGGIFTTAYTVSKHGIVGLTRIFANELARYGITVNAIAPGYMETDNTAALRNDRNRSMEILSRIPMGRWGKPDDLKGAVVFLASSAADYVTGTVLAVDGGWLSR